jgi:hypothetical protein
MTNRPAAFGAVIAAGAVPAVMQPADGNLAWTYRSMVFALSSAMASSG